MLYEVITMACSKILLLFFNMKNSFLFVTILLVMAFQVGAQSGGNTINSKGLSSPETVSVVDFGAKGDGLQNDAPAIQKALDSGAGIRNNFV